MKKPVVRKRDAHACTVKRIPAAEIESDARAVTVRVPITIRRRGGRKLVLAPDGAEMTAAPVTRHIDIAMVKAIARANSDNEEIQNSGWAWGWNL